MKRQREQPSVTKTLDVEEKVKLHSMGDKESWLLSTRLEKTQRPNKEEIEELWAMRPELKGHIRMVGKETEIPRYNQTYSDQGVGYKFSGVQHSALPIPELLKRYLDYANSVCHTMLTNDYGGRKFNMVFVNWYPDGRHYIGQHSDDEKQLFLNKRGETLIFSISLGQERRFRVTRRSTQIKEDALSLKLADSAVLVMGGLCQKNYKHGVPKTEVANVGPRINLTFRMFK